MRTACGLLGPGLALLLWLAATAATADILEGRVVHIADGDTLTILDRFNVRHKVRIAGIDAPERGQPFGRRATEALGLLARDRQVAVSGGKIDRYRRRVGIVRVAPQGCDNCVPAVDIGLSMIGAGFAWHYRAYEREQPAGERKRYREAEAQARNGQLGLWAEETPTPPWDWRRARQSGHGTRH